MGFSRAKRFVDLFVESMPFERLSKLDDKLTLKLRLEEEVRLRVFEVETLLRHGVRPPQLVAVDKVLVMVSLDVFAVGGGVGREGVLKLILATRRAIFKKISNAHTLTMPTHTAVDSY